MTKKYPPNKRLVRLNAGIYLLETYGVGSPTYLATLAVRGGGPPFELVRNRATYLVKDLDDWALNRTKIVDLPASSSDGGGDV